MKLIIKVPKFIAPISLKNKKSIENSLRDLDRQLEELDQKYGLSIFSVHCNKLIEIANNLIAMHKLNMSYSLAYLDYCENESQRFKINVNIKTSEQVVLFLIKPDESY